MSIARQNRKCEQAFRQGARLGLVLRKDYRKNKGNNFEPINLNNFGNSIFLFLILIFLFSPPETLTLIEKNFGYVPD